MGGGLKHINIPDPEDNTEYFKNCNLKIIIIKVDRLVEIKFNGNVELLKNQNDNQGLVYILTLPEEYHPVNQTIIQTGCSQYGDPYLLSIETNGHLSIWSPDLPKIVSVRTTFCYLTDTSD